VTSALVKNYAQNSCGCVDWLLLREKKLPLCWYNMHETKVRYVGCIYNIIMETQICNMYRVFHNC